MKTGTVVLVWVALTGCGYMGTAVPWDPQEHPGEVRVLPDLKPLRASESRSCGPTALSIVDHYYRPALESPLAPELSGLVKALTLRDLARDRGYQAHIVRGTFKDIVHQTRDGRPMIVGVLKPYWTGDRPHYEVIAGIDEPGRRIVTIDPARGWTINSYDGFLCEWERSGRVLLFMAPEIGDEEEGQLSSRAERAKGLQQFEGGAGAAVGHLAGACVMGLFLLTTLGNVVALPLGFVDAALGDGFIPGERWHSSDDGEPLYRIAYTFGFPTYCVGYLLGLPFGPSGPRPAHALPPKVRVDLAKLGITADALPEPERLALASPGEIVVVTSAGPALDGGLLPGDVLLEMRGKIVTVGRIEGILSRALQEEIVLITVLRDGNETVVSVKPPKKKKK